MHPPALDELGLVEALRQQLALARTPAGRPMQVSLEADELPGLPASVEVAAYRIATEAVTNSARHSGADQVWVAIGHESDLLLVTVRDGGESDDGTQVVARLPLDPHPPSPPTSAGGGSDADHRPAR